MATPRLASLAVLLLLLVVGAAGGAPASAEDGATATAAPAAPPDAPTAATPEAPKTDTTKTATKPDEPKTAEVTRGPFTARVEASGALVPRDTTEVMYEPQAYGGELKVVEAFEGGPVQEGQTLVRFDTEKIDDQIEGGRADLRVAEAALEKALAEARRQEEAMSLALEDAEIRKKRAEEAYDLFRDVQMPLRKLESEHAIQGTRNWIQDQAEELEQLEKMYAADDLSEETEEIVLRRSRRNLERAKQALDFAKRRQEILLEVELPREIESLELNRRRESLNWQRMSATSALSLEQARLELAKSRLNLERQREQLDRLQVDREAMTLRAPHAGLAVPGTFNKGKWSGLEDMVRAMRPGRRLSAHQVLFTVVRGESSRIRVTVPEAQLFDLKEGQRATVAPTAAPDLELGARVTEVARFSTDGNYEAILDLDRSDPRLLPGHTVKVRIVTEQKAEAFTVPATAVVKEQNESFVHVWKEGQAVKTKVKAGATSDGRTEVREGLAAGDRVLESPPKK
jgi:RND family efflux transporter MFP subunit